MKAVALFAIDVYQRYLSPYKGFCCAYRAYTGHGSCSVLGYRAIRLYGVVPGLVVLGKRFDRCTAAFRQIAAPASARRTQGGFCDIGCPCDACPGDVGGAACELPGCDMTPCDCIEGTCEVIDCVPEDCWRWASSPRGQAKPVYLPPAQRSAVLNTTSVSPDERFAETHPSGSSDDPSA